MIGHVDCSSNEESGCLSEYLQYGGQAVIEGVMMRSPRFFAVACRKPNGEIVVNAEQIENTIVGKFKWLNKPFLRGTLALIDAMALGTRALKFSADIQAAAVAVVSTLIGGILPGLMNQPTEEAPAVASRRPSINDIAIGGTMILA